LFPFVLGTEGIVKIYSGGQRETTGVYFDNSLSFQGQRETTAVYFDNSFSTKDKGKPEYILTITSVPRTKGNNRSIF
jgi:hypothetical protein